MVEVVESVLFGEEFQVNSYTIDNQNNHSLALLNDGGFVIIWDSRNQDGSGGGIYGQQYNADGSKLGSEFQVNSYTDGYQLDNSLTALHGGGFVVTWQSNSQDGSGGGIYGQQYNADGSKLGSEFQVNSYTTYNQNKSSLAALNDGGFVVTWQSSSQDGSGSGIYGQQYNADGSKLGDEFQINSYTTSNQNESSVTALSDGGFVVTWESFGQDGSGIGIYGQQYNANGSTVGSEFQVNSYTDSNQNKSLLTALNDGGFVVTWESFGQDGSGGGIYGQQYNANGSEVGSEFQVNNYTNSRQAGYSVTALNDGGFVVTWHSWGQDGSGGGIYGQQYNANGSEVGSEFQVNSYTNGNQNNPSVTALNDGGFVVTWESFGQDGSDSGIYGQQYNANGSEVGSEFQVNSYTNGNQNNALVTALDDGSFLAAWESFSQDGSGSGIYGRVFVQLPTLSFKPASNLTEPDTDGEFQLTLSNAFPTDITVLYSVGGTAIAGVDYNPLDGSVLIPAGNTDVTIPVNVIDDFIAEDVETITLQLLESSEQYNLSTLSADRQQTIEIIDNDNLVEETPVPQIMGEVGTITSLDHHSRTIQLNNSYVDPVVFALPLSYSGSDPAIARVTDLQDDNFSIYVQEAEYKDGYHIGESLSYLVLEAGTWELEDGTILEVGTVDTDSITTSEWESIDFASDFQQTPAIFSQVQTYNDANFVRTRQNNSTVDGFSLALEEEEVLRSSGHGIETVGWLAMELGSGSWSGFDYQVGRTGRRIDDTWDTIEFSEEFEEVPSLFASISSYFGSDPSGLRYRNLDISQVEILVEEDQSFDIEINHIEEIVDFLAISGLGDLSAIAYEPI